MQSAAPNHVEAPSTTPRDIMRMLTWDGDLAPLSQVCQFYLIFIFEGLSRWLGDTSLMERISHLDVRARQRLLLSPHLYYHLRRKLAAGPDILNQLELYLSGAHNKCDMIVAVGDSYIAASHYEIVLSSTGATTSIMPDLTAGNWRQPSVDNLAIVDQRINDALRLIYAISPSAYRLVMESVTLLIRTELPDNNRLVSSSQRFVIGRMLLANGHSPDKDVEHIANALVHEAIHSTLYKYELMYPLFPDLQVATSHTCVSPWSGRTLPLTSFVHACFVWWGLHNFWTVCNSTNLLTPASRSLEARARKGFASSLPLHSISVCAGVNTSILPVLQDMWRFQSAPCAL